MLGQRGIAGRDSATLALRADCNIVGAPDVGMQYIRHTAKILSRVAALMHTRRICKELRRRLGPQGAKSGVCANQTSAV